MRHAELLGSRSQISKGKDLGNDPVQLPYLDRTGDTEALSGTCMTVSCNYEGRIQALPGGWPGSPEIPPAGPGLGTEGSRAKPHPHRLKGLHRTVLLSLLQLTFCLI